MLDNFWGRKSCRLWECVEKYGTAGQTTVDSKIRRMRVACLITKTSYRHTFRICNSCCFSKAAMDTLARLNVTLCVQCLSSFYSKKRPGSSWAHPASYTVDAVGCSQRRTVRGLMLTAHVKLCLLSAVLRTSSVSFLVKHNWNVAFQMHSVKPMNKSVNSWLS